MMIRQTNSLLLILVSFLLAYWWRFGNTALETNYLFALLITLLLSAIVLPATGAYRVELRWALMRKLRRLLAGWLVVLVTLVVLAAALKVTDLFSRIWFALWAAISSAGLVAVALISHAVTIRDRNRKRTSRHIVLVGSGAAAARMESQILNHPDSDMHLQARFGSPWNEHGALPLEELERYIREHRIQEVWITTPWEDKSLLDQALGALKDCVVDVNVVPDLHEYRLLNQGISEWGGLPVISLAGTPMTGTEKGLKTVLDRVGALVLLIILAIPLLLLALCIRLGSLGPVVFRQKRHGINGETIEILKFRTMYHLPLGESGFQQAAPGDRRVTSFGRFLRRTSLDELPQLFNVLKGEMSLVGPRPHPNELNERYMAQIPRYMLRHKVKPGLTGWAQVNGFRGQTDTPEKMALRIEHDLWYIQNWSLWLDLKILLMTPFVMMHRNAY